MAHTGCQMRHVLDNGVVGEASLSPTHVQPESLTPANGPSAEDAMKLLIEPTWTLCAGLATSLSNSPPSSYSRSTSRPRRRSISPSRSQFICAQMRSS